MGRPCETEGTGFETEGTAFSKKTNSASGLVFRSEQIEQFLDEYALEHRQELSRTSSPASRVSEPIITTPTIDLPVQSVTPSSPDPESDSRSNSESNSKDEVTCPQRPQLPSLNSVYRLTPINLRTEKERTETETRVINQARKIIAAANAEAEKLKHEAQEEFKMAEQHCETILKEALHKAQKQANSLLANVQQNIEREQIVSANKWLTESTERAAELVWQIVQEIVGEELITNQTALRERINKALSTLCSRPSETTVKIHPEDLELLRKSGFIPPQNYLSDPTRQRGDVVIELSKSELSETESSLESCPLQRLAELGSLLKDQNLLPKLLR